MLHHLKTVNKKTVQKKKGAQPKTFLDYVLYFFVFTTPLFELPQAYIIYSRQDASDVSVATWGYFAISSVAWLTYGIRHRIWPIIFAYSLYLVIETSIVIGIIRYS